MDHIPLQTLRHDLYEACVQNTAVLVPLLQAIHGGRPRVLAEDFGGTAAASRAWVRLVPGARAVVCDHDGEVLAEARRRARREGVARRVTLVQADLIRRVLPARVRSARADVLFVGNFSIGEIHARRDLVRYFARSRARLRRAGVLVCDTYGGETAYSTGALERVHVASTALESRATKARATTIRYTWQQREADPLTGMVENALHFRVLRAGEVVQEITDAFVYRWRLWSVPELREAMREAGFARTDVYGSIADAVDGDGVPHVHPITIAEELGASYVVCVAGRV